MKITILGTGALGIALAKAIYDNKDIEIVMWTKFEKEKELLERTRENEKLLPGIKLSKDIQITSDLKYALTNSVAIINCLPFVAVKDVASELKELYDGQYICSTTKGIDMDTFETTTQIFSEIVNTDKVCALSGPSFAIEIANGYPISLMLAGEDKDTLDNMYEIISCNNLYLEKTSDSIGVQTCGAIKNAIAIGSGMLHGMKASDSTRSAYLTRGIKDMVKVITSLEGNHETVYTYAGIGDLILTCMSEKSRNFTCGKLLGQGNTLEEAIEKMNGKTVEGVKVIESLYKYMKEKKLELDTIPKLYDIVFNSKDADLIQRI